MVYTSTWRAQRIKTSSPIDFIKLPLIIAFPLVNVCILASWYNGSASSRTMQQSHPSFLAPIRSSQDREEVQVQALLQQVNSLRNENSRVRNEQSQLRYEIGGQIDVLKKKLDLLVTDVVSISSMSQSTPEDKHIFKVHLWDDSTSGGYREKKLYSEEGFATNPRTVLVDSPDDADIIVWTSVRACTECEIPPSNYTNVVLLDYADGCNMHQKRNELKHMIGYFKRSFVSRYQNEIGVYDGMNCTNGESAYPIAYSGIDALINEDMNKERKILITNVLRIGGEHNTVRAKIVNWTKAFVQQKDLGNQSLVGQVGGGSSGSPWDETLKAHFENSKIIVTCNPWKWEGDFRLWEALMSGALVMVDRMAIPGFMPNPFKHRKHIIFYDSNNQTEFNELLDYYVKNEDEAKQIGGTGYRHVLDHHMPKDRVSYIIDKIESKIEPKQRQQKLHDKYNT